MHPRIIPVVLALSFAAAAGARADEVVTKSGTKYEGKILSQDAAHVVIETTEFGVLRVPRNDIATVSAAPAEPAPETKPAPAGKTPDDAAAAPAATAPAAADAATPAAEPQPDEAERLRAELEALDAASRLSRRRAAIVRRRTAPGGTAPVEAPPAAATAPAPTEQRQALTEADFAATAPGTQVVLFERPHAWAAAASAIELGRRSWARFDQGGTSTAVLSVTVAEKTERLALRLAGVQRHVAVKTDASRPRLFEGIEGPDWLRVRLEDGTTVQGRYGGVEGGTVKLRAPGAEGEPVDRLVDVAKVVQVDGLLRGTAVDRALEDLGPREPVAIVNWPEGREVVGRFVNRSEHQVFVDLDGDDAADVAVPTAGPIAEVRRVPAAWRELAKSLTRGRPVRLRGFEDYPDARVERAFAAPLAEVTAYAVSVTLDDGCAVVPFEAMMTFEEATAQDVESAKALVPTSATELPVLPGMTAADAAAVRLPGGLTFVGDGRVVTQVYVAPPFERNLCGLRVAMSAEEAILTSALHFGVDVRPKDAGASEARPRELISETVEALRVTALVDERGKVSAIEISRR